MNPYPSRNTQRWFAALVHQEGLNDCVDASGFAHQELDEDREMAAIVVSLFYATRVAVYPPRVPAGVEGVGVDGLTGGEVLGLLVVYLELEDSRGRIHHSGLRVGVRLRPWRALAFDR